MVSQGNEIHRLGGGTAGLGEPDPLSEDRVCILFDEVGESHGISGFIPDSNLYPVAGIDIRCEPHHWRHTPAVDGASRFRRSLIRILTEPCSNPAGSTSTEDDIIRQAGGFDAIDDVIRRGDLDD
jgi:hypothetical protein